MLSTTSSSPSNSHVGQLLSSVGVIGTVAAGVDTGVLLLPPQPTDGSTQPHVESVTMRHSASSSATQQSATATSPRRGQAVPAGAVPAPEHKAPRDSESA
ncbi:hypothetical protein PHPALM_29428 [Phytophthora palmivora]|uniref:Uncharacterized protein n=1 Tax=Phytophthora palmivora TaxID=4796 RepID=A0A2P4X7K5_9STRA|nr:hypothetical protein PHPALM_29428 [Phytophthora palmivora]